MLTTSTIHAPETTRTTEASHERPDTQAIGEEIAELAAHIHAATCRLLLLLAEFDEAGGWHGWKSCAQWLSWRTGIGLEAAREKIRVARALPGLPEITAAFERGDISYSKVRAMTRIATPETEEFLLHIAIHGTASHVEKVVRGYRRADPEREVSESNRHHEGRYLSTRHDDHGNLVLEARLPAELGARVAMALDAAVDVVTGERSATGEIASGGEGPSFAQRRADALVLIADTALGYDMGGRRAADTHQVVVHVDAAVLADPAADGRSELKDGGHVSAETSRRLACDATLVEIREDEDGHPLSVGRRRRTVPPSIRRALDSRDRGCRFPGCPHTRFLEAHHVEHWADGGETELENLVNLCSFHHRELHEGGVRVEQAPDGWKFFNRYGIEIPDSPDLPPGCADELRKDQHDLDIDVDRLPVWGGDKIDYDFTISALLRLDDRRPSFERDAEPGLGRSS